MGSLDFEKNGGQRTGGEAATQQASAEAVQFKVQEARG